MLALLFAILVWLMPGLVVAAAEPKPTPRHDPADQPFRRAPMAESARSIVIDLDTHLHAAFDTELARIHTLWRGGPLNLFGPPYSHTKSPHICTFEGDTLFTFPKISPWFYLNQNLTSNFKGLRIETNRIEFDYELAAADAKILVTESITGVATADDWTARRTFHFPHGTAQKLRYLASAVGAESKSIHNLKVEPAEFRLALDTEKSGYYTLPPITEKNTEKLEPMVHHAGPETRSFVEIPARPEPFSFHVLLGTGDEPLPVPARKIENPSKTFSAAPEARRDSGDDHFRIEHFPLPAEAELIVTGMDWLNERDLAICTWLGEIYIVENAAGPAANARYRRFARGLSEPLGLTVVNSEIFVVQKGELTRVLDTNGDSVADRFDCISDDWGYSGNYHSYSFGPLPLKANGDFMVFITGQRGRYDLPYQGYVLRVTGGGVTPFCSGLRVPHGWGNYRGDLFMTDNQGNWIGTCKLNHLQEGKFYGFPSSMPSPRGPRTAAEVEPPALWLPRALSPSASGFETIPAGAFGPFEGQMLIGDFQNSIVMRACLEKVRGKWQGAVFPFGKGFLSGVNRLKFGPDGKLYVGGGKRTWSTAAPKEYSLERVIYTSKLPFEVAEVRALKDGFELRFTKPLEADPARDPANYLVKQFTYEYHEAYGSPEFDHSGKEGATETPVTKVELSDDQKTVRLTIPTLKTGYVTSFQLAVNSAEDEDPRHDQFYYTLNNRPD
jgi:glucose/arabinose dehydrogenase